MAFTKLFLLLVAATGAFYVTSAQEPGDDNTIEATGTGSASATYDQKASRSPQGDVSITVKGSAQWEEKISISKKGGGKQLGHHHEHYHPHHRPHHPPHHGFQPFFEPICCIAPTNYSDMANISVVVQKCKADIYKQFANSSGEHQDPRTRHDNFLKGVNCFLQCVGQDLGLSEYGVMKTQEVVDFVSTDSSLADMGVTREDIQACVVTSKHNTPEAEDTPIEEGQQCNMKNFEHLRFARCLLYLRNMHCPTEYQMKNPTCEKYRELLQRK